MTVYHNKVFTQLFQKSVTEVTFDEFFQSTVEKVTMALERFVQKNRMLNIKAISAFFCCRS